MVDEQPDDDISNYTDGRVLFPKSIFSVATFRFFLPSYLPEDVDASMLELSEVGAIGDLPSRAGTALGGHIGGLFHSSARAELAGMVTGLNPLFQLPSAWTTCGLLSGALLST